MKLFVVFGLLVLILNPLCAKGKWELVYPLETLVETLDLISIGSDQQEINSMREGDLTGPITMRTSLIGSNSGYCLVNYDTSIFKLDNHENLEFRMIKLPLDFDITAVTAFDNRWIVGGPNGEIGIHHISNWEFLRDLRDPFEFLETDWEVIQISDDGPIKHLASIDDNIVAIAGSRLLWSGDRGYTWEPIDDSSEAFDLVVFKGRFYALTRAPIVGMQLLSSDTGRIWNRIWRLGFVGINESSWKVGLTVFPEAKESPSRLYAYIHGSLSYGRSGSKTIYLSTTDGVMWVDHGSQHYEYAGTSSPYIQPLNPLALPREQLNTRIPVAHNLDWDPITSRNEIAGSYGFSIGDQRDVVYYLKEGYWEEVYETLTNWLSPMTTTQSRTLKFAHNIYLGPTRILEISKDSVMTIHELDQLKALGFNFRQLIEINGVSYGHINQRYGEKFRIRYQLVSSSDLENWDQGPISLGPYSSIFKLMPLEGALASVKYDHRRREVTVWDGSNWNLEYWTIEESHPTGRIDYFENKYREILSVPGKGKLYALRVDEESVLVDQMIEGGGSVPLASFQPLTWRGKFKRMVSVDQENLVIFGDTTELAIINMNGEVKLVNPQQYFPEDDHYISNLTFANGHYYLIGPVTIRTHDFLTFEPFESPNEQAIIDVREFDGDLYTFTENKVYKRPVEWHLLGSIAQPQDWYFSPWFGWFQMIDEELGDIDHLLFGKCWVKPTSELEYWIRTSTLGWMWMNKNWSPWFWRMDDGHWYWLDQKSWPPRIWDDVDQEWEELWLL